LSLLGPEAREALAPVRSLAHDTQDAAIRSAALATIKSISCADGLTNDDPAIRVASAEMIGRLGWRATPAVPALIGGLTDSETKVRYAAVSALRSLGDVSEAAVARLATALAREPDAVVRAAIVGAVEALAPGTPPVLEAHVNALRDPDPAIREQVLDRLGATSIRQPAIVLALNRFIERSDLPEDERKQALVARTTQASPAGSAEAAGASGPPAGSRRPRPAG
jgi:hypothetical protein